MSLTKVTSNVINDVDASKLTGSIADARVPASAVTQHVTATDLSPIENDVAILALQNAVNSNITAHGLSNYWIEQFEDSNSITGLTNAQRHSSEYMWAAVAGPADYTTDPYSSGDRTSLITATFSTSPNPFHSSYLPTTTGSQFVDGVTASGQAYFDPTEVGAWIKFDFGAGVTKLVTGLRWYVHQVYGHDFQFDGSNDDSNWTTIGASQDMGTGVQMPAEKWTGLTHTTEYRYYRLYETAGGTTSGGDLREVDFKIPTTVTNATGSFTSTTITPQDSASKNSLGLCLLYKNASGTNTLNTDIIAKVSADNGSNYSTCVLASKGTFSTGINIAIAPAISCTSGNQLKYRIEFANQASGSKVGQIHGVALSY
jgi:hypothetical protein